MGLVPGALVLLLALAVPARALNLSSLSGYLPKGALMERFFSPGALAEQHKNAACTSCHRPLNGVGREGCASGDCHPPSQMEQVRPAAVAVHELNTGRDCTACHPEHRGRQAAMTISFHQSAKATAQKDCAACHGAEAKKAHPGIAEQQCEACHRSTADWRKVSVDHRAVGGQSCAACHQGSKPRDGLHGGLGNTSCGKCHNTSAWKPARFTHSSLQAATRQRCADCHTPPKTSIHTLTKGSSCATCHGTQAWKPTQFRHPRIPEMREHMGEVGCRGCHPTSLSQPVSCDKCHGRGGFDDD